MVIKDLPGAVNQAFEIVCLIYTILISLHFDLKFSFQQAVLLTYHSIHSKSLKNKRCAVVAIALQVSKIIAEMCSKISARSSSL